MDFGSLFLTQILLYWDVSHSVKSLIEVIAFLVCFRPGKNIDISLRFLDKSSSAMIGSLSNFRSSSAIRGHPHLRSSTITTLATSNNFLYIWCVLPKYTKTTFGILTALQLLALMA